MSQKQHREPIIRSRQQQKLEAGMVGEERWKEIRRQRREDGRSISAIARDMQLDRKTVRRCLRDDVWRPYRRRVKADRLLDSHAGWLTQRAPAVRYSARILYQELRARRGYSGSYETVKR
ncbi:MAG: hypothetical protein R3268_12890, partial [Acidiferrobacterales bacterium]|nr:hypothetical protein [Acidiferrobacterales bacterium]